MSRQASAVFSSRVITDRLLSQGHEELLEARRAVAAWAFARSGNPQPVRPAPAAHTHQSTPVVSVKPLRLMVHAPFNAPALTPTGSSFTYANGTFDVGAGLRRAA